MRKRSFFVFIFLWVGVILYTNEWPDALIPLREAVYLQRLSAAEVFVIYQGVEQTIRNTLSGPFLYATLSRCEFLMGLAYQNNDLPKEAERCYAEGIAWAEKSLDTGASAEGWQTLAANIAQSCVVKPFTYAMANGLKVEKYSKNALTLDPDNVAAKYMIAARWVFAPYPFNNHRLGIRMMEDIITENETTMLKDDIFNVYSAIGYAYIQQKNYQAARPWLEKSLTIYPTNRFAGDMLETVATSLAKGR
jgi:tetratricopeptide (TPR) repeat protein